MHEYSQLAYDSIKHYLERGKTMDEPEKLSPELKENRAGVFVSIHGKVNHSLRGCIGTFMPTQKDIASEIIENAISAATKDPRFMPLTVDELEDIEVNVDVLSEPKDCKVEDLDPKKFGVIVKTEDGRKGLLLPDLEGIDTVEKQLEIACSKAGIDYENDEFSVMKFSVERYV